LQDQFTAKFHVYSGTLIYCAASYRILGC
jgi:hypothetical protein